LINEVPRAASDAGALAHGLDPARLAELLSLVLADELTTASARTVLAAMIKTGQRAAALLPAASGAPTAAEVEAALDEVIAANPAKVAQYRAGKTGLIGFFVGQVLRATAGADPAVVNQIVTAKLG
jgi:Asp-tRNA(Asn)/Glu-tRNA(Gln) amidotransferase B subunit